MLLKQLEKIPNNTSQRMINTLKQKRVEHSFLAKSLHWLFVVMFGYGVFKQIESKEQLNEL